MIHDPQFAHRLFNEAAPLWLASRVKIKPRTRKDYEQYIRALSPFFGDLALRTIHLGHIRAYQVERSKVAGPARVNHEVCLLAQLLRRAGTWSLLEEGYEPLPLPYWQPPRTMTDEEEQRFFELASSRPEWELVYCFALLSVNIGAAGCEMRGLRIADVDLVNQRITIRRDSAKNKYRVRRVPLVASAMWAAQRLLEIAAGKGARAPHHFLFPFRAKRNQWDPTRPMTNSGIKKPWLELRRAAGLDWLTPHCLRHQANTKLYEAGADDMTVMSIMGHQTRQMSEHYSQIRERRKREALEAAFEPSYRTTPCS
jgi:integrase